MHCDLQKALNLVACLVAGLVSMSLKADCLHAQVSVSAASRLGLEIAWNSQIQMPVSARPIVSAHLWPSSEGARQYAETVAKGRVIRVFADTVGPDGSPMGIATAKDEAKKRCARILGTFSGIQVQEGSIPRIYLVVITSDGVVQTFDAETGLSLWRAASGTGRAPVAPGSVGKLGVSVTNGNNLCLFEWTSGKMVKNIKLRNATSTGVAMAGDLSLVPSYAGVVAAYGVGEKRLHAWQYTAHGTPLHPPVTAHIPVEASPTAPAATTTTTAAGEAAAPAAPREMALVAVVTNQNFLYVFANEDSRPAPWFRFVSQSPLTEWVSSSQAGFYVGDNNGNVFKIAGTRRGGVSWRYSMGSPIVCDPFVVSDKVLFVNQSRRLVALEESSGNEAWTTEAAGIEAVLASSKTRLYAKGFGGSLIAVDASNGKIQTRSSTNLLDHFVANQLNDRLYLINRNGQLQCLRENGALQPTMHVIVPQVEAEKMAPGEAPSQLESSAAAQPTESTDPFGATEVGAEASATGAPAENPFGETAAPAEPATGDTPAGAEPAADANPFTTGANPF